MARKNKRTANTIVGELSLGKASTPKPGKRINTSGGARMMHVGVPDMGNATPMGAAMYAPRINPTPAPRRGAATGRSRTRGGTSN